LSGQATNRTRQRGTLRPTSQRCQPLDQLLGVLPSTPYLLPTEMRQMARAGVPTIWAWPTVSWINHPDRDTELTVAAALTQAVIELYDRTDSRQSRSSALAIIDSGAGTLDGGAAN